MRRDLDYVMNKKRNYRLLYSRACRPTSIFGAQAHFGNNVRYLVRRQTPGGVRSGGRGKISWRLRQAPGNAQPSQVRERKLFSGA